MATRDELLAAAKAARVRANAPYSLFQVGAAVETDDGSIVTGCNVENASYGLGICAERVALTSAVAAGHKKIRAIAVAGPDGVVTAPCGACRQFIAEFDPAMPVTYTGMAFPVETDLSYLLPDSFGPHALGRE
jgi:cytidine deaminase